MHLVKSYLHQPLLLHCKWLGWKECLPGPWGGLEGKMSSPAKVYQSVGCKSDLKLKEVQCFRACLQQNENKVFQRCEVPVSLLTAVILCSASLMEEHCRPGDISDHAGLCAICNIHAFFQMFF